MSEDVVDFSYESVISHIKGKRVALIGGAGFIGHNLALDLSKAGANVMIIDNLMINNLTDNVFNAKISPGKFHLYQNFLLDRFRLLREHDVTLTNCDARIYMELNRILTEFAPEKIVHLSAIASAVEAAKDPGLCFDTQLLTLRNTLEWIRLSGQKNCQIMFLSSSTVYGDFETPSVDESVRPQPKGIYANAKYMGERLLRTYRQSYGLQITIVRPSALYGERCISGRVSQAFIENALTGKPLLLEGGGDGRLDFTYIHDLVEGMIRALALPKGINNTFNLTFGNARTIADLAGIVRDVIPSAILEERPRAADKPIRGTLSTERAWSDLGFKARWALEVGYRQYCEWYVSEWKRAGNTVPLA